MNTDTIAITKAITFKKEALIIIYSNKIKSLELIISKVKEITIDEKMVTFVEKMEEELSTLNTSLQEIKVSPCPYTNSLKKKGTKH